MDDVQWLVDMANGTVVEKPSKGKAIGLRVRVSNQVRECTRCPLRNEDHEPVPMSGPTFPEFIALGEAPGQNEMKMGEPFVGKSGSLLRSLIDAAGLDNEEVAYMNTVCCWPHPNGKTTAPDFKSQLACRDNMVAQLASGYTKYVLLVGVTALHAFREDLAIAHTHGQVLIGSGEIVMMPIYHPAGMLQSPDKEHLKKITIQDLKRWKGIVEGGDIGESVMGLCAVCGDIATEWDEDAVGYCVEDWEKGKLKRNKARQKWKGSGGYGQEVLFDA